MYSKNFVVAIIVNGKVSDETKDGIIAVPFESEYTIRLRNKNNRRAVAIVYIDDENVSAGGVVVKANNYVDFETPVDHPGKKFKFVSSKSGEAIEFGKNNKTDGSNGVIRVEWKLEKELPPAPTVIHHHHYDHYPLWYSDNRKYLKGGPCGQSMTGLSDDYSESYCSREVKTSGGIRPQSLKTCDIPRENLKEGCTVEGGYSNQTFRGVHLELESGPGVIIQLILRGFEQSLPVVGEAQYCGNCGKRLNKKHKFCSHCGRKVNA